jgi:SAM-dependent methyltransferase
MFGMVSTVRPAWRATIAIVNSALKPRLTQPPVAHARDAALSARVGADAHWRALVACVSEAYRAADGHAARFAASKLKRDPVFRHVFEHGLIPPGATVLDLGCGQGLLAGCAAAAAEAQRRGDWPAAWGPAPTDIRMIGLELNLLQLRRAAAGGLAAARFVLADMRRADFPPCDVVACIDTLHYMPLSEQDDVLLRARNALRAGGVLLLRVNDASAPLRWRLGLWIDRITRAAQGGGFEPVHGRTLESWCAVLTKLGLEVECRPMNGRLPFANLLLVARQRAPRACTIDSAEVRRAAGTGP